MSVRVMSWVWEHSRAEGTDRLVLLAIADSASDDGNNAWPSISTLADKAKVSPRTVQRSIRALQLLGEITMSPNAGRHGTNVYQVHMVRHADTPSNSHPVNVTPAALTPVTPRGDTGVTGGVSLVSPEPSFNHPSTVQPDVPSGSRANVRGSRIGDWKPGTAEAAWSRANGYADQLAIRETEKFRDYWTAESGARARKADWGAAWRNWIRRAAEQGGNTQQRQTDDMFDRAAQRLGVTQ
jgi:hypothetical protein